VNVRGGRAVDCGAQQFWPAGTAFTLACEHGGEAGANDGNPHEEL